MTLSSACHISLHLLLLFSFLSLMQTILSSLSPFSSGPSYLNRINNILPLKRCKISSPISVLQNIAEGRGHGTGNSQHTTLKIVRERENIISSLLLFVPLSFHLFLTPSLPPSLSLSLLPVDVNLHPGIRKHSIPSDLGERRGGGRVRERGMKRGKEKRRKSARERGE